MVRMTTNHILRCSTCLACISDEGEIICKDTGCIVINDATNIVTLALVKVATGVEIQPVICSYCEHPLGFRFEQNEIFPAHQHKIVLHPTMLTMVNDSDIFMPSSIQ